MRRVGQRLAGAAGAERELVVSRRHDRDDRVPGPGHAVPVVEGHDPVRLRPLARGNLLDRDPSPDLRLQPGEALLGRDGAQRAGDAEQAPARGQQGPDLLPLDLADPHVVGAHGPERQAGTTARRRRLDRRAPGAQDHEAQLARELPENEVQGGGIRGLGRHGVDRGQRGVAGALLEDPELIEPRGESDLDLEPEAAALGAGRLLLEELEVVHLPALLVSDQQDEDASRGHVASPGRARSCQNTLSAVALQPRAPGLCC